MNNVKLLKNIINIIIQFLNSIYYIVYKNLSEVISQINKLRNWLRIWQQFNN